MSNNGPNYTQSYGLPVGILGVSASSTTLTNGSVATLLYATVVTAPSFGATIASNVVTIAQAGLYMFAARLTGAPATATASLVSLYVTRGGVYVAKSAGASSLAATTAVTVCPSVTLYCNAGDALTFGGLATGNDFTYTSASQLHMIKIA